MPILGIKIHVLFYLIPCLCESRAPLLIWYYFVLKNLNMIDFQFLSMVSGGSNTNHRYSHAHMHESTSPSAASILSNAATSAVGTMVSSDMQPPFVSSSDTSDVSDDNKSIVSNDSLQQELPSFSQLSVDAPVRTSFSPFVEDPIADFRGQPSCFWFSRYFTYFMFMIVSIPLKHCYKLIFFAIVCVQKSCKFWSVTVIGLKRSTPIKSL